MKKVKLLMLGALLISALVFSGCSKGSDEAETDAEVAVPVTVSDLAKSGASEFITSKADAEYAIQYIMNRMKTNDGLPIAFKNYANEAIGSTSRVAVKDIADEIQDKAKDIEEFTNNLSRGKEASLNFSLKNTGDIEGLPEGFKLNIGAFDCSIDYSKDSISADTRASYVSSLDVDKFLKAESVYNPSVLKGLVLKMNEKVDMSFSDEGLDAYANIIVNAGVSFCLDNSFDGAGLGGIALLSAEFETADISLNEKEMSKMVNDMMETGSLKSITDLIKVCKISFKFYDDDGNLTCTYIDSTKAEDLIGILLPYAYAYLLLNNYY